MILPSFNAATGGGRIWYCQARLGQAIVGTYWHTDDGHLHDTHVYLFGKPGEIVASFPIATPKQVAA